MKLKRILILALIVCLLSAALPRAASAADSPALDNVVDRLGPLLGDGLDALTDWLDGKAASLAPELRETLRDIDTEALFSDLTDLIGETRGMDDEQLREAILALAERHGVHLVERQIEQLMKLCRTLEKLDAAQLRERADALRDALRDDDAAPGGLRGAWDAVRKAVRGAASWLQRVLGGWFKGLR